MLAASEQAATPAGQQAGHNDASGENRESAQNPGGLKLVYHLEPVKTSSNTPQEEATNRTKAGKRKKKGAFSKLAGLAEKVKNPVATYGELREAKNELLSVNSFNNREQAENSK